MSRTPVSESKLETVASMLEHARAIVAALELGETVETEADADVAIDEACDAARAMLAASKGDE